MMSFCVAFNNCARLSYRDHASMANRAWKQSLMLKVTSVKPVICCCFLCLWQAAVERLLKVENLMSTDQQVIYIMYNAANRPRTRIQTYRGGGWFGLGYLAREAGVARMKRLQDVALESENASITTVNKGVQLQAFEATLDVNKSDDER